MSAAIGEMVSTVEDFFHNLQDEMNDHYHVIIFCLSWFILIECSIIFGRINFAYSIVFDVWYALGNCLYWGQFMVRKWFGI